MKNKKLYLSFFLGLLIIFLLIKYAGFFEIWQKIKQINPLIFLGIFVLTVISLLIAGARFHLILKIHKQKINYWNTYHISTIGVLGNALTPGVSVGGEALRIILFKKHGVNLSTAITSIILIKILDFLIILPFLILLVFHFFYGLNFFVVSVLIALIFLLYLFGFMFLVRKGYVYQGIRKIISRFGVKEKIKKLNFSFNEIIKLTLMSYARWLIFGIQTYWIVKALGIGLSYVGVLGIFTVGTLVRIITPLPFGLGVAESVTTGLYSLFGANLSEALTVSLVTGTYVIFILIILGLYSSLKIGLSVLKIKKKLK